MTHCDADQKIINFTPRLLQAILLYDCRARAGTQSIDPRFQLPHQHNIYPILYKKQPNSPPSPHTPYVAVNKSSALPVFIRDTPYIFFYLQTWHQQLIILSRQQSGMLATDYYPFPLLYMPPQHPVPLQSIPRANSGNSKMKTSLCKKYSQSGYCPYGLKCQFAHGVSQLRCNVEQNNYYKTKPCRNYYMKGCCVYGDRCNYSHRVEAEQARVGGGYRQVLSGGCGRSRVLAIRQDDSLEAKSVASTVGEGSEGGNLGDWIGYEDSDRAEEGEGEGLGYRGQQGYRGYQGQELIGVQMEEQRLSAVNKNQEITPQDRTMSRAPGSTQILH